MTRYLLDTTVLIDFAAGRETVRSRVLALIRDGSDLGLAPVTIAEYYAGVAEGDNPAMDQLIRLLPCWDTTRATAIIAGEYRRRFQREFDRKLPTPDTLIAATARQMNATLLTNNLRDFPMPDIVVEHLGP